MVKMLFYQHVVLDVNCAFLGCFAACIGNSLPTSGHRFDPIVKGQESKKEISLFRVLTFEGGTDRSPETSVRNYHYELRNNPGRAQI
jgi:hypothetical protein